MAAPLLKWAGGKRRIADRVLAAFGEGEPRGLLVPFLGGGSVALAARHRWPGLPLIGCDVSPQLIACYRAVRDAPDDVIAELHALPMAPGWRDAYNGIREAFNDEPVHGPRQAARMVWLNRAGYGGMWRTNRRGRFNVSADRYAERVAVPGDDKIRAWADTMAGAVLDVGDGAASVLRYAAPGWWVYADPPYLPIDASSFVHYSGPFPHSAHVRLSAAMGAAAAAGARGVVSNADSTELPTAYSASRHGAQVVDRFGVRRTISRAGDRPMAAEVLIRFPVRCP